MTRRYFVPELPPEGGALALPEEESMHAAKVMRVQIGDEVTLFSGNDLQSDGRIVSVDRKRVFVAIDPPRFVSRELPFALTVGVALPKGDRMRMLVEKLTELGVSRLVPIIAARSQAAPSAAALEKLRRAVIESSKQCERNRLMEITDPARLAPFIHDRARAHHDRESRPLDLIAHPGGHSFAAIVAASSFDAVNLLVGPEGGFTDEEVQEAVERGWQRVGLGRTILRVETAALAAVARLVLD